MNSFHVVTLIPSTWKAIIATSTLTAGVHAKVWVDSVVVESMHLTLMSEQAGIRRES